MFCDLKLLTKIVLWLIVCAIHLIALCAINLSILLLILCIGSTFISLFCLLILFFFLQNYYLLYHYQHFPECGFLISLIRLCEGGELLDRILAK